MTTRSTSTGDTNRQGRQQPSRHQSPGGVASIEPDLLAVKDAARFLSLSERSVDDLVAVGELHPIRVPGMRRKAFRTSDLRAAVRRWAVASGAAADDSETPSARDGYLTFLETKNGEMRRVPMSPAIVAAMGRLSRLSAYVFVNTRNGKPYTPSGIRHIFNRAIARAGITSGDVTFHTLRHTALSRMIWATRTTR